MDIFSQTEIKLDNGALTLKYQDEKQLFKDLLEANDFTYKSFACKFDLSTDAINSWLRKERTVERWAIVYLLDTLELKLKHLGVMLDVKKSDFLVLEITQLQKKMEDLRLENETIPEPSMKMNTDVLITDAKPVDSSILLNIANIIKSFLPSEHQEKCS